MAISPTRTTRLDPFSTGTSTATCRRRPTPGAAACPVPCLRGLAVLRPAVLGERPGDDPGPAPVRPDQRLGGKAARWRAPPRGVAPAKARGLAPRGGRTVLRRRRGCSGGGEAAC